jgi:hypothetical protein
MKCPACGYKQGYEWDEEGTGHIEVNPKNDKFVRIDGIFLVNNSVR